MQSITKKMIGLFIIFMFLLLSGMSIMNLCFYKEFKIHQNQKKMIKIGDTIKAGATDPMQEAMINEMFHLAESYNVTIRVINERGEIVFDTMAFGKPRVTRAPKELIDELVRARDESNQQGYYMVEHVDKRDRDAHLTYISQMTDGEYLVISRMIGSIEEDIATSNYFLMITGSILAVVGVGIIYILARKVTKPILMISKEARAIANLDFSQRISVHSKDEIGVLADSMNEISEQLSKSMGQLKADIQQRKQLVRDLSHELKTPITSIKGYTEALKFGVIKDQTKQKAYYEVIVNECDRMTSIIHEMLELSKLDRMDDQLQIESFGIEQLEHDLYEQLAHEIQKKGIQFQTKATEITVIQADYHLILRAVKNLVDNAIRYTPENGVIKVRVCKKDDMVQIIVHNSGSVIPEEQLETIFDVFYKVDGSRKHENHTYGIGLSIVKSIVELHQGTVVAKNEEDGVTFVLEIPQEVREELR